MNPTLRRRDRFTWPRETETLLEKQARWDVAANAPEKDLRVYVLASFTVEPLRPYLSLALHDAGFAPTVEVGPFDQIIATCLDAASPVTRNPPDVLLVCPHLEWSVADRGARYRADLLEVAEAAASAALASAQAPVPGCVVFVLPPIPAVSPAGVGDAGAADGVYSAAAAAREAVRLVLRQRPGVYLLDFEEIIRRLGLSVALDVRLEHLARAPFSERALAELGSAVARLVALARGRRTDAVVLEPNQLLWSGDAHTTSSSELEIGSEQRALAAYLAEYRRRGGGLALRSRLPRAALQAALARPEHLLRVGDFAWVQSAEDAGRLELETADPADSLVAPGASLVALSAAPEAPPARGAALAHVVTCVLPDSPESWPEALQDVGLLDRLASPRHEGPALGADAQDATREDAPRVATGLAGFLASLRLEVNAAPLTAETVKQVAHITETSHDFNATGVVYSEEALRALSQQNPATVLTLRVRDRFGDYGVAGVIVTRPDPSDELCVDGLWLTCRVLGKGVEAWLFEHLRSLAQERGCTRVRIRYVPDRRNRIVQSALSALGPLVETAAGWQLELPSAAAAAALPPSEEFFDSSTEATPRSHARGSHGAAALDDFLERRWGRYAKSDVQSWLDALFVDRSAEDILAQIAHATRRERGNHHVAYVAPRTPTEERVAAIMASKLRLDRVGTLDNFFLLGGHSLLATQLVFELHREFGVELPVRVFFENPTVALIAHTIDAQQRDANKADTLHDQATSAFRYLTSLVLPKEVRLDSSIEITGSRPRRPGPVEHVFLTGASGFLGAFLLDELLRSTRARVSCLVRGATPDAAHARLTANLQKYGLDTEALRSRVSVVHGDLAEPRFGLSETSFARLANETDCILHAGAVTNFVDPYAKLRAANVGGTEETLRLAALGHVKPLHFVSTIYVFSPINHSEEQLIGEDEMPLANEVLHMGYTQSKWVAEHLLKLAESRGIPCTIHRSGRISGHSRSGACQSHDFLWRMIRACVELGVVFDREMAVDMAPVDYVSRAIVALMQDDSALGKNFHLHNPTRFDLGQLLAWMRSFGYPVRPVTYEAFRETLLEAAACPGREAVAQMLTFFPAQIAEWRINVKADDARARAVLGAAGIACPQIDEALFHTYLRYFADCGFLPPPQRTRASTSRTLTAVS